MSIGQGLNKPIIENYKLHRTLENTDKPNEKIEIDEEFQTVVNSIIVEQIGKNE